MAMPILEPFEVFAYRELTAENGDNYMLSIGKPVPHEHGEYSCPYRVVGPNYHRGRLIRGVDSIQAVFLAMKTLKVEAEILKLKMFQPGDNGLILE
jgi:hypothetical protein